MSVVKFSNAYKRLAINQPRDLKEKKKRKTEQKSDARA